MPVTVSAIYRYPVKGLSPERLDEVRLAPGAALPNDRRYALARASTRFNPDRPEWQHKQAFLMLMLNERLAALETHYDDLDDSLTILRGGRQVARGVITTPVGRAIIEDFIAAYMSEEAGGKPRLIEAPPDFVFSDHESPVLSLINLASLRDLERIVGRPIDPLRFRANVYVEGLPAWAEFDLLDRAVELGGCRVTVAQRIPRCPATNVEPGTGSRDMNLPRALKQAFGHVDMGIYCAVVKGGILRIGDDCLEGV